MLETRLRQTQAEAMAPIDLISCLVSDELTRRGDPLLQRRRKQASFRDPDRTLDNFDFSFYPKINRSLVFDLSTGPFINKREDALFLGPSDPETFLHLLTTTLKLHRFLPPISDRRTCISDYFPTFSSANIEYAPFMADRLLGRLLSTATSRMTSSDSRR